jgi:hypothetical protein
MDALDAAMMGEPPSNRREDPGVAEAFILGAVGCKCGHVHFDLVDAENRIFATAKVSFSQFLDLASVVYDDMERIEQEARH